jgi:hypothetical protein
MEEEAWWCWKDVLKSRVSRSFAYSNVYCVKMGCEEESIELDKKMRSKFQFKLNL